MSEAAVLQALQCACSQDPSVLKIGEQQLKAWETEKGFYSTLAGVFTNRGVEPSVRWMAITCIKNGADRYWRLGAPSPVEDEEKAIVRSSLLQCIEEPVQQVSTQLSVLIARIARIDCPAKWPELLPFLSEAVRSPSELMRKCSLVTLKHVIKTLAARRLVNYRKVFYDVTTSLFIYIVGLWSGHLQEGVAQISAGSADSAVETLEMSRVCLKILRQMIVHGFPRFSTILEALQFLNNLFERIPALMQLRIQLPPEHPLVGNLEQNICLMTKTLREVQNHHPIGFVPFITPSLQLVNTFVFTPDNQGQLFERFVIQVLNLFSQILRCEDYSPPETIRLSEVSPPPQVMEAHQAKLTFFKASACQAMLERLVCHFMLLSDEELRDWEEDPEDFVQEKAGEMYQHSLRACVENAYVTLFHEFQLTIVPYMLSMIQAVQNTDATADPHSLRVKEAVYKATGLGAYELYDEIEYDSWYSSQLLNELRIQDPRYKIVRHRVVWLLGNWVAVKMSTELRPSLYSVLVSVLQPCEDLVVRLAAAESLRYAVDDFGFSVEDFVPYLADSMTSLFQLLLDVRECDTKMRVLNVLSLLMERLGGAIQPHISALLQYMPQLWVESAQRSSSMLRCVILTALTNIVRGLGPLSPGLHAFLLPVVQMATDIATPEHVYLAEDGLDLWLATLHHAPAPTPDLIRLLGNMAGLLGLHPPDESSSSMPGLMDIGSDSLEMCFKIMDAYVVLCTSDPTQFVQGCGEVIVQGCQSYLCDVRPEGVVAIVKVMERVVHLYPSHFPQLIQPVLPTVLRNLLEEEDYPPTTSAYLSLLARVLLQNSSFFFTFLEGMAVQAQQSTAELFGVLIDHWSDKLDSMANVQNRKLTGLAVGTLLPLADSCVTSRFGLLVNMCVEVLHDVMDTTEDDVLYDTLVTPREPSGQAQSIETEHDKREKQLAVYDPVRAVSLHNHVSNKLQECVAVHGAVYAALMQGVDVAVREQLAEFLPQEQAGALLAFEGVTLMPVS